MKTDAELYAEAVAERHALWERFIEEQAAGRT